MAEKMRVYNYKGDVKSFSTIVSRNWTGSTRAISEKKAAANLVYQYKRQHRLASSAKITLSGVPVSV